MSDGIPKNNLLWGSIAQSMYSGIVTYVLIIVVSFLRDVSRNMSVKSASRPYAAIVRWYHRWSLNYRDTYFFYYVEAVRLTTNLIICVLYVLGTFQKNVPSYTSSIYIFCSSIYITDLFIHILMSESAISYVTSFNVLIDAVSFPSLILSRGENDYLNFAFLRAIPAFTAYSRLERRLFVHHFSHNRLLIKLCFKTLTLFYTLAASIQLLELPGDLLPESFINEWKDLDWNFMNSAYFIIVTLSTVGYGDFSPATVQGRMYALFIIIIGIIVFSSIIGELVEQANRDRGSGYFIKNNRTRHVIVTGNPNLNDLVLFITEFYSDPRQANVSAKVVVLVENPAWSDTEWFQYIARNQFLQTRLQFFMGSARNSNDLARVRLDTADSVFILTSPSTGEDPSLQDTRTIMQILAIRNARSDIPIYAQTLLEESNLQTQVALSTIANEARAWNSERDREQTARYPGLFKSVLQAEYRNLPRAYQGTNRRHMESILTRHVNRNEKINMNLAIHDTEDSVGEALRLSQHVCLQEIQMALIAGNIKANGVGTLLSNMYLDVPTSKLTKEDPGWLYEYLMGAASNLLYTIIPEELNGVSIKEIANDLFHVGIVLVAISDPINVHPHPILSTDEKLRTGDLAMLLSYHERIYVTGGFHLVALRYARGELRHKPSQERNTQVVSGDDRTEETPSAGLPPLSSAGVTTQSTLASRRGGAVPDFMSPMSVRSPTSSRLWVSPSLHNIRVNISADDLDALAEVHDHEGDDSPSRLLPNPPGTLAEPSTAVTSRTYIPDNMKGHVIIAIEGSAPLENLPLLLRNLWHKDKRRSMQQKKRVRIVVIHPHVGDELRKRFSRFEGTSLFFIEGSPASRGSWRRAKLNTANAAASVADITQPMHLSDARTIFTLLTLDVSTAHDHDLFICSELIDEKSLEYLREPTHPRRAGAALGESMERGMSSSYFDTSGAPISRRQGLHGVGTTPTVAVGNPAMPASGRNEDSCGTESRNVRIQSASVAGPSGVSGGDIAITSASVTGGDGAARSESKTGRSRVRTIKFDTARPAQGDSTTGEDAPPRSVRFPGSPSDATATGRSDVREASVGGSTFSRLASKALPKKTILANLASKPGGAQSADAKSLNLNMPGGEPGHGANLQGGTDPSYRPGATRARRSTLFARSRYASGELLVQSSALTLLAREYIEPGFVTFFTNVLGTDVNHPGMKIRLVRIPKSLFSPTRGYTCRQGRPYIRYNDVVQILIGMGVTPLGIYRSGSAPVLIPYKMRRKRGIAIGEELAPLLEHMSRESDLQRLRDDGRKVIGDRVKVIAKRMKDVNPARQREYLGRDEIHGNVQHLFSFDSSEDEDEDDEDDRDGDNETHHLNNAPTLAEGGDVSFRFATTGSVQSEEEPTIRPEDMNFPPASEDQDDEDAIRPEHPQAVNVHSTADNAVEGEAADTNAINQKQSVKWGLGIFKGSSHEDDKSGALLWGGANRDTPTAHTRFVYNTDPALAVPGRSKYSERPHAENLLPYVYTLPDPNTWCGENDGIFIICDPSFDLPGKWTETLTELDPKPHDPA